MSIYSVSRYVANRAMQGATGMRRQKQDHAPVDTPHKFSEDRTARAFKDVASATRETAGAYRITISQAAMRKMASSMVPQAPAV
ncbi:MAG: hypothetical protein HQL53_00360 [Magnetococcales bacterium]|nr:hypothetical protein [Magnetococcales bacterium]